MLKRLLNVKVKNNEGENVRLVIRPENHAIMQKLRIMQAQLYSKLIKEGVPTKAFMLDLLKREGIWTDAQESELNRLAGLIALLELELSKLIETKADEVKQKETAIRLAATRNYIFELIKIKSEPLEFVAESIIEEMMIEYYIVESTQFESTGLKYFISYDDFKNRRNDADVVKICNAFTKALGKDATEFIYSLPENQWFAEKGLLDIKSGLSDDIAEQVEKTVDSVKIDNVKTDDIQSQVIKE